jgi:hypothetical protein
VTSATGPDDPIGPTRPTGASTWLPDDDAGTVRPGTAGTGLPVPETPADFPYPPSPHPTSLPLVEHAHLAPPPAPRHRRRAWTVSVSVLSVLLVATASLATYLWLVTDRQDRRSAEIEAQARTIGTDLATLRAEHEGTLGELAGVTDQLETAQERITQLADEKAQVGDDREVQRQLVDYQARVSQAAANVASALSTCIDAQNQLITYLEDAASYDPADLERFKGDVQGVCAAATEANTELRRQLASGTSG